MFQLAHLCLIIKLQHTVWIYEKLPSKLPKLEHFGQRKARKSELYSKIYKTKKMARQHLKKKISKETLELSAIVIMINGMNSPIKEKIHLRSKIEFNLVLSSKKIYVQSIICKWNGNVKGKWIKVLP